MGLHEKGPDHEVFIGLSSALYRLFTGMLVAPNMKNPILRSTA
jgi:hypothetical protein